MKIQPFSYYIPFLSDYAQLDIYLLPIIESIFRQQFT
jgi:hypothetical protein